MNKNKINNRRLFFHILIVVSILLLTTLLVIVGAAYFAQGEFKDVFVSKKDYFSADVLYEISPAGDSSTGVSIAGKNFDVDKFQKVGSAGSTRNIHIYNYGDSNANAFDVKFTVYAWLSGDFPNDLQGKSYTLSCDGSNFPSPLTTNPQSVFTDLTLTGGGPSTETLTVDFNLSDFGFKEGDDLTPLPHLYVVAVPTEPARLTSDFLGAVICPTWPEGFSVNGEFEYEQDTDPDDYAAFIYRVNTVGMAPDGDKICIKWDPQKLTLIRVNSKAPGGNATVPPVDPENAQIQTGTDGTRTITWKAQSNRTDYFTFFRASQTPSEPETTTLSEASAMNETEATTTVTGTTTGETDSLWQSWDVLKGYISVQHIVSTSAGNTPEESTSENTSTESTQE